MGEKDSQPIHPMVEDNGQEARGDPGPLCSVRGVRARLRDAGLRPSKRRGQNFLCHSGILAAIVQAGELSSSDVVLEIGAGLGVLTAELASRAGHVIAIELDRNLCGMLEAVYPPGGNVQLVCGDVLRVGREEIVPSGGRSFKVIANLPYYLTSPLLEKMLVEWPEMTAAVIMVQEEVARRLVAHPGSGEYGSLTVMVNYYAQTEIVRLVPPSAFWPRPDVRSAVVRLVRHSSPPVPVDSVRLFRVVRAAFGQRRKQLRNSLTGPPLGLPAGYAGELLARAGIDGERRAETMSLAEFAALAQLLPC